MSKPSTRSRIADHLLEPILAVILATVILPMLLVYRAALQPDYTWGLFVFSGTGITPGYLGVILVALFCWATLIAGLREKWAVFRPMLLTWAAVIFGILAYGMAFKDAELRGDAWWIDIDVGWVVLVLAAIILLAALFWAANRPGETGNSRPRPVSRGRLLLALSLAVPVAVLFLLGDGQVHTNYDRAAVAVVVVQCVLIAGVVKG